MRRSFDINSRIWWRVGLLSYPIYGRTKAVALSNDFLLHNVPCPFTVLSKHRYYVKKPPANFQVIAKSIEQDIIYAVKLYDRHHYGVQFHPERRNDGTKILQNFIEIVRSLKVTYSKMPKKGEVY